jgi:hypothetical protein
VVALALLAAAEPAATVQAPTLAPVTKTKRVCHVEEAVTGSITPKRVCVTVPQAAPVAKPAQDAARERPQQASSGGSNN